MSSAIHDFAPQVPRRDGAVSVAEVDRRGHSRQAGPEPVAAPVPAVDRTLHQPGGHTVTALPSRPASASVLREAPRNHAELNAFIAERAKADADLARRPAALSPAAQTGSALTVLDAHQHAARPVAEITPLVAEARSRLRDAQNVRAGAREALAAKEAAMAKAQAVEHAAIIAESQSRLAELDGGDDFARRVVEWAEKGGDEPDLAPDAASLDARHERDRARVKAAHARQAVAAIGEVVEAKRAALAEAETRVQAAARGVVEMVAEDIASEGRKAGEIHRRAELAAVALQRMQAGLAAAPLYRLKPDTAALANAFVPHGRNEPPDSLSRASATWQAFHRALEADADAALG
ncbi:hypothetical protein MKK88_16210 [Methylobacterium sp. E-005]|uniref:hypothetical protein n=1 Tax=Methylobacterium sp. E-005 TaxID=2836549 RepID=UPI001FBABE92|nr:hypothetical protein [Methylobacterium sp. E-005]MCJ2087513.1 hypothetical protein [Methylobacterium sp. E-005]